MPGAEFVASRLMESNPYSSPNAAEDESLDRATVQYRVFCAPWTSFVLSLRSHHEKARREAQQAIDVEIGADNVISINECYGSLNRFSVVVWYRARSSDA